MTDFAVFAQQIIDELTKEVESTRQTLASIQPTVY